MNTCSRKTSKLFASKTTRVLIFWVRMLQICFKQCCWVLLLLALLLLTVTVRQTAGGRQTPTATGRDTKPTHPTASTKVTYMRNKTLENPISTKIEIRIKDKNQFVQANDFVIENPLEHVTKLKPAKDSPGPKPRTLMERIEAASSPSLYAQMRSKLKWLGSAVTEEQLGVAAGKCGGQTPTLRYVQSYDFMRSAEHLCSGELLALVAVHSNAKNLSRRATIRRTWGSLRYIGQFRIEVAFFLGLPASGDSDESGATGAQLRARIGAESDRFGDIVQLGFTENYRNLTIKHLGVYEWLLRHCRSARYLVKVDDDTFTDVAHLATYLSLVSPTGLYCSATQRSKPFRPSKGSKSKWIVSWQEFSGTFYPTYCEGFAYILHAINIPDMYLCSFFKQFFWIDDVHVTGTLAASVGVPASKFRRGHGFTTLIPSLASESIVDHIFLISEGSTVIDVHWHKIWHSVLQYSLDCRL